MLLADAGATVIKVEPTKGDFARTRGVLGVVAPGEQVSAYLAAVNRGKQSITLDLKSDSGLSLARERIGQAGLVVENFSSRTMSRLGLGLDAARTANRRLITASISLAGSDTAGGPSRLGLALIAEGEAGMFHQPLDHRESPLPISSALGDMATGLACYAAICTALLERERTGVGGHVDISMIRTLLSWDSAAVATHSLMKRTLGAVSPDDILLAQTGILTGLQRHRRTCNDCGEQRSDVGTAAEGDREVGRRHKCALIKRDDRSARIDEVREIVESWSGSRREG